MSEEKYFRLIPQFKPNAQQLESFIEINHENNLFMLKIGEKMGEGEDFITLHTLTLTHNECLMIANQLLNFCTSQNN